MLFSDILNFAPENSTARSKIEQLILQACEDSYSITGSLSLQTLASVRSLIINLSSSDSTLLSILEILTRSFRLSSDSYPHHHYFKLLADLSFLRPLFSRIVRNLLNSNSLVMPQSTLLSIDALATLAFFISDHNVNLVSGLDNQLFVSLCFYPCVSVRLWLLRNAERFHLQTYLLFTVFFGFTKDPYPLVRKVALDGLFTLSKSSIFEDIDVIKGCYCRAVELLLDNEDYVRRAAVRVVCEWGQMLIRCNQEVKCKAQMLRECDQRKNRTDFSDVVFLQLCSMVRDMSMEVRLEAFDALGKIGMPSEDILLQTLSKKVLKITEEKKFDSQCNEDLFEISASVAVGAFMHGLEDEFYEVRKSTCLSLGSLTVLSEKFASEASNLLVNMLNDDSVAVRLQALETMHHMANSEKLKLLELDMHMFLGTLVDSNDYIRVAAREILKLVKLPSLELFKLCIDGLLESMEIYPQDEADVFSVLFYTGQNHQNFAVHIINEMSLEIQPHSSSKLGFDNARVAAYLVLAISVPFSSGRKVHFLPPIIFSCAATMLGRISCALSEMLNQDSLLVYLSQWSRSSSFTGSEFDGKDSSLHESNSVDHFHTKTRFSGASGILEKKICKTSENHSSIEYKLKEAATSHTGYQLEEDDEIRKSVNLILAEVTNTWSLTQSGCADVALRTLRACEEEILKFPTRSCASDGAVAFTLQYLKVVKLLLKVWQHFVLAKLTDVGELEFLLGKLERRFREIRCRFLGLSAEEESHILELILVTYLLRQTKVVMCCCLTTVKMLSSMVSQIEFCNQQGSVEPSKFIIGLKEILHKSTSTAGIVCRPSQLNPLLDSFFLRQLSLGDGIRHIHAELDIAGNSFENPILFVPGLPVAIPLVITLYNILSDSKLWFRMTIGERATHFVYLDPNLLDRCGPVQKLKYVAPFYKTPNVASFSLRICIGMECLFEEICPAKGFGGPKHTLADLCGEQEIYLSVAWKG